MANLKSNYLGLNIKNPLIASASALSKKLSNIKLMEDSGIAGVVLYSLFEEEINHESLALDHYLNKGTESFAEALTYFPELDHYNTSADDYVRLIEKTKQSVDIPIIASLNGVSTGGWIKYARAIEEAGADALELNIYFLETDISVNGQALEETYLKLIADIKSEIKIPLAVKISPFFTSLPNTIDKITAAGADGVVLFNRFYQPDLDIEAMSVKPELVLSTSNDLLLPLRWTAILYKKVKVEIGLTGGVHDGVDMAKALFAGATVTMVASEFVKNGINRANAMLGELETWMDNHGYEDIDNMRGILSQQSVKDPDAFERANYMKGLIKFDNSL